MPIKAVMKTFKTLPHSAAFFVVIIIMLIGMWLWITPFYNYIVEIFEPTPIVSAIAGVIIVVVAIKMFKLHPW